MELQLIQNKIFETRGQKVMLDFDLAELYQTETKYLKRSVRANIKRFPPDFMFELSKKEWESLRCNYSTSNKRGGTRYLPFAFTEQGVSMLSSVLNSDKAIDVNIAIMRAFVTLRKMLLSNTELRLEIEHIKKKVDNHGKNIELVFQYLDELLEKKENSKPRKAIGFKIPKKKAKLI